MDTIYIAPPAPTDAKVEPAVGPLTEAQRRRHAAKEKAIENQPLYRPRLL